MKVGMAIQKGLKHHAYMICGKKAVAPAIMDPLTYPNPEVLAHERGWLQAGNKS